MHVRYAANLASPPLCVVLQECSQEVGPGPSIEMLFQIFKLNFSRNMSNLHYFSDKFSKIAKRKNSV